MSFQAKSNGTRKSSEDKVETCPWKCCAKVSCFQHQRGIFKWLKLCDVAGLMIIFGFGNSFFAKYRDNLVYRQFCVNQFHEGYKFCFVFKSNPNITEKDMEVIDIMNASITHTVSVTAIKAAFEFISCCFICPWSDKYGRKFPIMLALLGENFEISTFFFSRIPFFSFLWMFYLISAIAGLSGGRICLMSMCYSYLTDHSSLDYRTFYFTIVDVTYLIGTVSGTIFMRNTIGQNVILESFLYTLFLRGIAVLWVLMTFMDKDFRNKNAKVFTKLRMMFSLLHVKENYTAFMKWRANCGNEQIKLILFSSVPATIAFTLMQGIITPSLARHRTNFDIEAFQRMSVYLTLYNCAVEALAIVLSQFLFRLKDSTIGIIGCLNFFICYFVTAFAEDNITHIVAQGLSPLRGFTPVSIRSSYSKLVSENERGKTLFLLATCEVMAHLFGYLFYDKFQTLLGLHHPVISEMIICTALILTVSTFVFQYVSLDTEHLFKACYRNLPVPFIPRSEARNVRGGEGRSTD